MPNDRLATGRRQLREYQLSIFHPVDTNDYENGISARDVACHTVRDMCVNVYQAILVSMVTTFLIGRIERWERGARLQYGVRKGSRITSCHQLLRGRFLSLSDLREREHILETYGTTTCTLVQREQRVREVAVWMTDHG